MSLTDKQVNQPGSYWYHSHNMGQYPDGLRGPLIIKDPAAPFKYDGDLTITVTDWYHEQMPSLISYYLSPSRNPDGAEPVPYSALLNEAQNIKLNVLPGKTYLIRIISMAAFAQTFVHFDQHTMTIVEMDGVYTQPQQVDSVYVATAQRYGVLLTTKSDTTKNYAILGSMDGDKFDNIPGYLNTNVTGYLVYNTKAPLPKDAPVVNSWNVIDDFNIPPLDGMKLLNGPPDASIVLNLDFFDRDGQNR